MNELVWPDGPDREGRMTDWSSRVAVALTALVAWHMSARADMLWRWSYVNRAANVMASGMLTTKDRAGGSYQITGVTGAWNGAAIVKLEPVKSCCSPPGWNTNVLLEGAPGLDKGGFAFSAAGGLKVNLFYKDGRYTYEIERGAEVFGGAFEAKPEGRR